MNKQDLQNKAQELETHGEVTFTLDGNTYAIWETEQGDENVRGEEYMNYMINVYDEAEYKEADESGEDAEEFDGGICTGTSYDAVTFLLQDPIERKTIRELHIEKIAYMQVDKLEDHRLDELIEGNIHKEEWSGSVETWVECTCENRRTLVDAGLMTETESCELGMNDIDTILFYT